MSNIVARIFTRLRTAAAVLWVVILTTGCAQPPARLERRVQSDDVAVRRESVVSLRAYATAGDKSRARTKALLITALEDPDAEVRRLAALGLINYRRDDDARRAVAAARQRASTDDERAVLSDVLSRFR